MFYNAYGVYILSFQTFQYESPLLPGIGSNLYNQKGGIPVKIKTVKEMPGFERADSVEARKIVCL